MKNKKYLITFFLFIFCSNIESSPTKKIDNCIQLADEIERVFDEIQVEAYKSEIYKSYSYIDATKLDYINEALRINKIGIDGLENIMSNYEINNQELQNVIDGFYNNFVDSRNANTALEEHLVSINNDWNIQDEVQWWEENQEYSIKFWRTSDDNPSNLIQAQRDFFGSHTVQLLNSDEYIHIDWREDE